MYDKYKQYKKKKIIITQKITFKEALPNHHTQNSKKRKNLRS